MILQLYLHTVTIPFLLSFNVFGMMNYRSLKIIVCCRMLGCDSGRNRSLQNFTDSISYSDSSQSGSLRPTPTPVATPTPQPGTLLFCMNSAWTDNYSGRNVRLSCLGDFAVHNTMNIKRSLVANCLFIGVLGRVGCIVAWIEKHLFWKV